MGHELAAALYAYPFPHAFPPYRVLRFPFPQIPTRHGQLPDEETRWSGPPRKKRKKELPGRALYKTRRLEY